MVSRYIACAINVRPVNVMRAFIFIVALAAFGTGCAPTMTPLYRDFEVQADSARDTSLSGNDILDRIRAGLENADWPVSGGVTENTVETEPRTYRRWGIYNVQVHLEVVPVGNRHVRVMVHPYRVFFNHRSRQIGYLRGSLARSIMNDIRDPFEEQGLAFAGFAQARDAQETTR